MFVGVVKGNIVVLGGGGVLSKSGRVPYLGGGGQHDRQGSQFSEEITFIEKEKTAEKLLSYSDFGFC